MLICGVGTPTMLGYAELQVMRVYVNANFFSCFSRSSFPHRFSIFAMACG